MMEKDKWRHRKQDGNGLCFYVILWVFSHIIVSQVVKPIPLRADGTEAGSDSHSSSSSQSRGHRSPSPGPSSFSAASSSSSSSSNKTTGKPDSPGLRRRRGSPVPVSLSNLLSSGDTLDPLFKHLGGLKRSQNLFVLVWMCGYRAAGWRPHGELPLLMAFPHIVQRRPTAGSTRSWELAYTCCSR